jgi:DNA repair exonuclease SbcCD ATPase subunit
MQTQLRRGILGYRTASVREALEEQERSIAQASLRATTAEKDAVEAAELAERLRVDLQARVEQLAVQGGRLEEAQRELEGARAELEILRAGAGTLREEAEGLRAEVERLRVEAEGLSSEAERRRAAEERAARLGAELDELRHELFAGRQALVAEGERLRRAEARVAELEAAAPAALAPPTSAAPSTTEEVSDVLRAAQEAMSRLIETAGREAAAKLGETEAEHRRITEVVERLTAWRDRMTPLVGSVRASMEEARLRAARIGERIQEAVEPMNQAIAELDRRLTAIVELRDPEVGPPVIELHDVEPEHTPAETNDPRSGS